MISDTVSKLADAIEALIAFFSNSAALQSELNAANAEIATLKSQLTAAQALPVDIQAKADKALADATAATTPTPPAA